MVERSASPSGGSTTLFTDNFEGANNWTISANWQILVTTTNHSATHSAWSNNLNSQACDTFTKTTLVALPAGTNPVLHFWTYFNIESGWDNGIVYGSSNGTVFTKLTPIQGYPGTQGTGAQACLGTSGQPTFNGSSTAWTEYTVNLTSYASGNFTVRFTYATDSSVSNGGWYIDDVKIDYPSACTVGGGAPGKVLNNFTVVKSGTNLNLSWSAPGGTCLVTGYGLYRGTLPWTGYNHAMLSCAIATTSTTTPQQAGSNYYLIVPLNSTNEGSYGTDSAGIQRPQGSSPCHAQSLTACN
jgi:Immune inhibitor A-like, MAM domain